MDFRGHAELDMDNAVRFSTPLKNAAMPRWQRKALEARAGSSSPSTDRFIPSREAMDLDLNHYELTRPSCSDETEDILSPGRLQYRAEVGDALSQGSESSKILAYSKKAPAPKDGYTNGTRVLYNQNRPARQAAKTRSIPQKPERVLDAPELLDDYYLNLLDWNDDNVVAIALGRTIYLWNYTTQDITELMTTAENDHVTSVSWAAGGATLAVGTNNAEVQLWDVSRQKQLRTMRGHNARVASSSWNQHILSTGARDGYLHHSDVRVRDHLVASVQAHSLEVCGLKWSPDGTQLASGGNDNILNIWDGPLTAEAPRLRLTQHRAAVKALAWCPWQQGVLASGAGSNDRHIRLWNTQSGACLNAVDTKSQVCSIVFNAEHRELVSSHGFAHNQLSIWKYSNMTKVADLTGHTQRVLHMAISPDGTTVATAAADETLRFWRCFEPIAETAKGAAAAGMPIRGGAKKADLANTLTIR